MGREGDAMGSIRIAVCNETIPQLQQLASLAEGYGRERPDIPVGVQRFQSLFDLVEAIRLGGSFQICLLDRWSIQPWMEGLSAEAVLRQADPGLSIVGFTADVQSAFLSPGPADPRGPEACLVKPVSTAELYHVLDRLIGERFPGLSAPSLELPTPQGPRSLPFRQLVRVHYRSHVVTCFLDSGEAVQSSVLRVPFSQITQPLLQTGEFSWVSSSCVVNLAFVKELDAAASTVRMLDGKVLPVPKAAFPALRENLRRR